MNIISNFYELEKFYIEYNENMYLKKTIIDLFECLYRDTMDNKSNFNLKKIVNGNSTINLLQSDADIDILIEEISDSNNSVSWCINFIVNDDLNLSFYHIGVTKQKSYCVHYFVPSTILDLKSNSTIYKLITSSRIMH